MPKLAYPMPALPFAGFGSFKTYAAWPVWSDSTTAEVNFQPMPKKAAARLFHRARAYDRQTKAAGSGNHGGALGHSALQVLHSLLFDFLNYKTGRLDPAKATIARLTNLSERCVANALDRLRACGVIHWIRRCAEDWQDGRFVLRQQTNAYAVLPESQWRGYVPPPEPPKPDWWGACPPLPSILEQATAERRAGASFAEQLRLLDGDPSDSVAVALASYGRALNAGKSQ